MKIEELRKLSNEDLQKKMNTMLNGIEEIFNIIR